MKLLTKPPYIIVIPGLLAFLMLINGCQTTQYLSNENLEALYNEKASGPSPQLHIFHPDQNSSQLMVKVNPGKLTYEQQSSEATARFDITYRIYKNYEYRTLFDSSSHHVTLRKGAFEADEAYTTTFTIPQADQYYLVAVRVRDKVAEQEGRSFIYYRPYSQGQDQNYIIRTSPDSQLYTKRYLSVEQPVQITSAAGADSLKVEYYRQGQFEPAPPPFEEDYTNNELFGLTPDTGFTIAQDQDFHFPKRGFYAIQASGADAKLTLRVTNPYFPELKKPNQLREAIRYISSRSSYQKLQNKPAKAAVDQFWLNRANKKKKRAKRMIQRYYQRVQGANAFFTTYKKGWKTDRGLVYIIFGKPYIVYRTNQREVWLYPNKSSMPTLEFRFERQNHALAPVYYQLSRSRFYRDPFYKAVEQLRETNAAQ